MTPDEERIFNIFMPYAARMQKEMEAGHTPLVHYTSAEAGLSIIQNKKFWMREASCMNDFSEVLHGCNCLISAFQNEPGKKIRAALDSIDTTIIPSALEGFDAWLPHLKSNTFLSSFSVHDTEKENDLGRLSMWRGYGSNTGVALVLDSAVFFNESEYFCGLYTSPVAYLNDQEFALELIQIAQNIADNQDFLSHIDKDTLAGYLFRTLVFASLCTKHKGFAEELEWRLTYLPKMEACPNITPDCVTINGIPQIIQKILLENVPSENVTGLDIPELIKRVIIGPSQYGETIARTFVNALKNAGDNSAESKVVISGTPLRV